MKVLIATDAWHPQVNGVVSTYERLAAEVAKRDVELSFLTPQDFRTVPCPTYPEIRLAVTGPRAVRRRIEELAPDFIHIATEGPVGLWTRRYCLVNKRAFTTSYHTRFPEYLNARLPIPLFAGYAMERWFHGRAAATFVATQSVYDDLTAHGFERLMYWCRGVDTELFRPRPVRHFGPGPVFLYVGRIAVEKNIEAFLKLDLPGTKVLTGGGPQLDELKRRYPQAVFTGPKHGEELAEVYASADVFVFPSRTDTFGLVLLEAMASGVPVAAYPVCGPKDVVTDPAAGILSEDLREAALGALKLSRKAARDLALTYSWEQASNQFIENVLAANDVIPRRLLRGRLARYAGKGAKRVAAAGSRRAEMPDLADPAITAAPKNKAARLGGNRAASHSRVDLGDAGGVSAVNGRWGTAIPPSRGRPPGTAKFRAKLSSIRRFLQARAKSA